MLENTGAMAGIGAVAGGIIGSQTKLGGNRYVGAQLGALGGAAVGAGASMIYKASVRQKQYAQARANEALNQNHSVMKSVKATGANYVAVPVKADPDKPGSKPALVRVKVERSKDGTMKAGEVDPGAYPIEKTKSNGDEVHPGGVAAILDV